MPQAAPANGLDRLQAALDRPESCYDEVIAAFREMPEIAATSGEATLRRAIGLCYRVLGIDAGGPPMTLAEGAPWQRDHLLACARNVIEKTLYDDGAFTRVPYAGAPVRPRVSIAPKTAEALIGPYLDRLAEHVAQDPSLHLPLAWHVARAGIEPFRGVILSWVAALDEAGTGMPGTRAALDDASMIADSEPERPDVPFGKDGPTMLALLEDAHILRVAAAAKWLGMWYAERRDDPAAPSLPEMLDRLRRLPRYRPSAAGAFVCGLSDLMGLADLFLDDRLDADFDREAFVLDILAPGDHEPYLPIAQSFWFYVHEYYDYDAPFVGRLLDAGHAYVALMCATERNEKVDGMKPVLQRLARHDDPWIAGHAAGHLKRNYA